MSVVKLIIKSAIAGCLIAFAFKPNGIMDTIMVFSLIYGLVTYYIWYFTSGDMDSVTIGDGILGILLTLAMPLLSIGIGYYALDALLPGGTGQYIFSGLVVLGCFGCLISDIVSVIRIFSPSFLNFDNIPKSDFPDSHSGDSDNFSG
ncbi:MAG: hypothetical protein K2N34_10555 [Lachnospiraceae bacterium]|nr:hypothetical protein [Lachnospiraceae bacterium]